VQKEIFRWIADGLHEKYTEETPALIEKSFPFIGKVIMCQSCVTLTRWLLANQSDPSARAKMEISSDEEEETPRVKDGKEAFKKVDKPPAKKLKLAGSKRARSRSLSPEAVDLAGLHALSAVRADVCFSC